MISDFTRTYIITMYGSRAADLVLGPESHSTDSPSNSIKYYSSSDSMEEGVFTRREKTRRCYSDRNYGLRHIDGQNIPAGDCDA